MLEGIPTVRPELLALQLFDVCSYGRAERLTEWLWSERVVIFEVQSERYHSALVDVIADARRLTQLRDDGVEVAELTDDDVWARPWSMARLTEAAVLTRGKLARHRRARRSIVVQPCGDVSVPIILRYLQKCWMMVDCVQRHRTPRTSGRSR